MISYVAHYSCCQITFVSWHCVQGKSHPVSSICSSLLTFLSRPSLCQLYFITSSIHHINLVCSVLIDGEYIKVLLWWIFSCRLQLIIQELDLGTSSTLELANLSGKLPRNRQWVYIIGSWLIEFTSVWCQLIYSHLVDFTRYLAVHFPHWWIPSCLLLVFRIGQ